MPHRSGEPLRFAPKYELRRSAFLLTALGLIAVVSLPPSGTAVPGGFDRCLVCGGVGAASALLNVVLYVPLGAALWRRGMSAIAVVAVGALLSLAVEMAQLLVPGRHSALSDVLANTFGAGVGGLLVIRPRAWARPTEWAGHMATAGAVLGACAAMAASGYMFQPTSPAGDYYGQWKPTTRFGRPYDGTVVEARLGELRIPPTRFEDSEAARNLFEGGSAIRVGFAVGSITERLTPVFRVVAGPYGSGVDVFELSAAGETLVLSRRLRADDHQFQHPRLHIDGALAGLIRGDTVTVEWQPDPDHGYVVRLDREAPILLGFTVGRSWSLLSPSSLGSSGSQRLVDHGWMFALAAVVGWFSLGILPRTVSLLTLVAVAEGVGRASHLLLTPLSIHGAIIAGFGIGCTIRQMVEGGQRRVGAQTS